MTEVSDEELERNMRRKLLFGGASRRHREQFTPEQQAIAAKLIGHHNVERLERRPSDGRRFRPTPVFVHYEVWWFNGGSYTLGGWRMARIENGKRADHHFLGEAEHEVNRLRAAGFTVKELKIEGAPSLHEPKPKLGRKSFSARFGDFGRGRYRK